MGVYPYINATMNQGKNNVSCISEDFNVKGIMPYDHYCTLRQIMYKYNPSFTQLPHLYGTERLDYGVKSIHDLPFDQVQKWFCDHLLTDKHLKEYEALDKVGTDGVVKIQQVYLDAMYCLLIGKVSVSV